MAAFVPSATIDVKRNIFDLCTDSKDCYLAVIEVTPVVIPNHLGFLTNDEVDLSFASSVL